MVSIARQMLQNLICCSAKVKIKCVMYPLVSFFPCFDYNFCSDFSFEFATIANPEFAPTLALVMLRNSLQFISEKPRE